MSTRQRSWADYGQILRHKYEISVAEAQTSLTAMNELVETAVFAGYFQKAAIRHERYFNESLRNVNLLRYFWLYRKA